MTRAAGRAEEKGAHEAGQKGPAQGSKWENAKNIRRKCLPQFLRRQTDSYVVVR